ncbi:MAG: preprotein translocase subunit SecY [Candidatus Pacebacteria bacterium]|nr:preprotein translocase subunit SecY [Candidatus Paceibacterota bacterium]
MLKLFLPFKNLIKIFKIKELRKKLLFVCFIFIIFRIMANIPIPGVDAEQLKLFFEQFQVFGLLNVFTGGTLQNLSIIMLGLGPYITSTVILQLLSMIFPQLERMYKQEGEAGKEKFNQYGRIIAIPLALLQGYTMLTLFQRQGVIGNLSAISLFSSAITIAAGTMVLMWFGELISEKGIGNGTSLLIFAGIISKFPQNILQIYSDIKTNASRAPAYLFFLAFSLFIIFGVVLITEARRNIPVSYARRVRGRKMYGGAKTHLPLNINPAGVMPIIFALSLLTLPGMIANFFVGAQGIIGNIAKTIVDFFANPLAYGIFYFVLVFLFVFFYTMVIFDPKTVSDNLKRMGGFIPGIRPGEPTTSFLHYTLYRILPIGALFLGGVALAPTIIGKLTGILSFEFLVGGTSLLILVSVILETYQEIRAYLQMQEL